MMRSNSACGSETVFKPFAGNGHRLSDAQTDRGQNISTTMIPREVRTLLDKSIPATIPSEKIVFIKKWDHKHYGPTQEFDLGRISMSDMLNNSQLTAGVLNHVEIHVLWGPHLPVSTYGSTMETMTLEFTGTAEEEEGRLSKGEFIAPLHTHLIFYPGHSCNIGRGKKFPWKLRSELSGVSVNDDYNIADVFIKIQGYRSQVSVPTSKSGADVISMVPLDVEYSGVTYVRPRTPGASWIVRNYKTGVSKASDGNIIQKLSQYGVDVEALQMANCLAKVIKGLKGVKLDDTKEARTRVISCALEYLKKA